MMHKPFFEICGIAAAILLICQTAVGQDAVDQNIFPAVNELATPYESHGELEGLAAGSVDWMSKKLAPPTTDQASPFGLFSDEKSKRSAIKSAATLVLVICLFLSVMLILRFFRRSAGRSGLPGDVVALLGQTPLGQAQKLQLIRLGSKILLVSTTQHGSHTLGEIADPEEVYRIESICREGKWPTFSQTLKEKAERHLQSQRSSRPVPSSPVLGSQPRGSEGAGRTLLEA